MHATELGEVVVHGRRRHAKSFERGPLPRHGRFDIGQQGRDDELFQDGGGKQLLCGFQRDGLVRVFQRAETPLDANAKARHNAVLALHPRPERAASPTRLLKRRSPATTTTKTPIWSTTHFSLAFSFQINMQ